MSKRWKTRQRNAAKLEKSYDVQMRFYDSVIKALQTEAVKRGHAERLTHPDGSTEFQWKEIQP